jgi:hypothetical protein
MGTKAARVASVAARLALGAAIGGCGSSEFALPGSTIEGNVQTTSASEPVRVTAGGPLWEESTAADGGGDFRIGHAPTGDVMMTFGNPSCEASMPLDAVVDRSLVRLEHVAFDCTSAAPSSVAETFRGVIRERPSSVCVRW